MNKVTIFLDELQALESQKLLRCERVIEASREVEVQVGGDTVLLFSSNNYLGLATHPRVKRAACEAIDTFGVGAGASRLISGTTRLHTELEKRLAEFKGGEAGLVFSSGYQTNLGVVQALVDSQDALFLDRLSHASLVDACRLAKAKLFVYPHADMKGLERLLAGSASFRRRLILTDSVFSMDGDVAPLSNLLSLAKTYDAMTLIDEAHATGILGKNGRGALEHFGLQGRGKVDVVMGTLSKALGSLGGFVVGDASLVDFLRNKARSFIYTTALPVACCAAALAALELVKTEPWRREKLRENNRHLRRGLDAFMTIPMPLRGDDSVPIVSLVLGDEISALTVADQLYEQGLWVPAIRPPTVPKGTSRLRISLMATHTIEQLDRLIKALKETFTTCTKN